MSKADDWRDHITAQRQGGSIAVYCHPQQLAYASLMYWRRRLARGAATSLVPVAVQTPGTTPGGLSMALPSAGYAARAGPGGARGGGTGPGTGMLTPGSRWP